MYFKTLWLSSQYENSKKRMLLIKELIPKLRLPELPLLQEKPQMYVIFKHSP